MRLFKTSEYAIRCLVYMAGRSGELCSVKRLSDELKIPYKFLGRLMAQLGAEGIVQAERGKNGGYRIAKPLEEIHLSEIVDLVEGPQTYDRCILGFDQCDDDNPCAMHKFWTEPKDSIVKMMHDVTLAQMAGSGGKKL
jgi:Rrf2 family transcriptional regulator, iron-sulfur cluster assembly transcription factor